jgi:methenyltetrahydromethanopterin cyclohydrolase
MRSPARSFRVRTAESRRELIRRYRRRTSERHVVVGEDVTMGTTTSLSVNRGAMTLVRELIERADELQIEIETTTAGATVIDMGQRVPGSWEAGRLYAEITMGGLGSVSFGDFELAGHHLRSVLVSTEHPVEACWVAQKHADRRSGDPDDVILAGPAKALLVPIDPSVAQAGYQEMHRQAVAPLQLERRVTDDDIAWLARACQLPPRDIFVLVAPTPSLVCAIQVVARSVDNAMHRLHSAGLELTSIESLRGSAPVPPRADDELSALGRINDSLMYGTQVHAQVRYSGDLSAVATQVASQPPASRGRPFLDILAAADNDFHNVPLDVFCIAEMSITDIDSGSSATAGDLDYDLLATSFYTQEK